MSRDDDILYVYYLGESIGVRNSPHDYVFSEFKGWASWGLEFSIQNLLCVT